MPPPLTWLDAIAPATLFTLHLALALLYPHRIRSSPHPAAAWLWVLGPALYGLGACAFVLTHQAIPFAALAGLGPLTATLAVAFVVHTTPLPRAAWTGLALLVWVALWLGRLGDQRLWPQRWAHVLAASYLAAAALGCALVWRHRSGLERRALAPLAPFLLAASVYLLLKPERLDRPVFSTLVLIGSELALLCWLTRFTSPPPRGALTGTLHAALLALGALLLLLAARTLGWFPPDPLPLAVATSVAVALALSYALLQPALELWLHDALFPEAAAARRRAAALAQALQHTQERLREAEHLSVVGQLAAKVAHEIKNPLGPIKGYVAVIERELARANLHNERVARGLDVIRQEVDAIDARARGLLTLSRPPRPSWEHTDLTAVAREALELVALDAPPDVSLGWRAADPAPARTDPALLRGALLNLLQNAVQAVGTRGQVTLGLTRQGPRWLLTVDDDGPGLPTPDTESLFGPFVTHREHGTGLGLAITRGSLQALGGDVTLHPRTPTGTRAEISLPADPQETP